MRVYRLPWITEDELKAMKQIKRGEEKKEHSLEQYNNNIVVATSVSCWCIICATATEANLYSQNSD